MATTPRSREHVVIAGEALHGGGPPHEPVRARPRGERLGWRRGTKRHTTRIIERLNRDINVGLSDAAVSMRYAELAAAPFISTPAELRKGQIWTSELGIGLDRHLMHNSDLGMQRQHADPPGG